MGSFVVHTDVIVVGASIAGLATALCLARRGIGVFVLDRGEVGSRPGEVLPPAIREVLAELGLWERFLADAPLSSAGVTLWWGSDQPKDWDYLRSPYNEGWHIDRPRFVSMLRQEAIAAGATLITPCAATRVRQQAGVRPWCVQGSPSFYAEARLLVHASGRNALLDGEGGGRVRWDRLVGLYAYHSLGGNPRAAEPRLWVESTRDGWWYSAPLRGGKVIAAFITEAGGLGQPFANIYRASLGLAPATSGRLTNSQPHSAVVAAPCETSKLRSLAQRAFLAVGDAAYTVDPVSGRGIIKALRMALSAASAIDETLAGREEALGEYAAHWDKEFQRYLAGLAVQYRGEQRWPDAPFWKRRMTSPAGSPRQLSGTIRTHPQVSADAVATS